jgi:hypothetical protein
VTIAKQWRSKHIYAAVNQPSTVEELLKMVIPMWSTPRLYNEDQQQLSSVVS